MLFLVRRKNFSFSSRSLCLRASKIKAVFDSAVFLTFPGSGEDLDAGGIRRGAEDATEAQAMGGFGRRVLVGGEDGFSGIPERCRYGARGLREWRSQRKTFRCVRRDGLFPLDGKIK